MLLALCCVCVPLAENSLRFSIRDGSILLIIRRVSVPFPQTNAGYGHV
jgi:hypothetical protein